MRLIENPQLGSFIENAIFQEVMAGMASGQEVQNAQYARAILERFANPSVEHKLISICLNCSTKVGIRVFPSIRDFMARNEVMPRRLLFGLAAVILVLRDPDVQDTHAQQVREMWERVDSRSANSVLVFVQEVLAKQMEWSREKIDLKAAAPQVAGFLMEIREHGLLTVMASCLA